MIDWKDVTRAAALVALLAGTTAAQPPFVRAPFEPRVEGFPYRAESVIEFVGDANGNVSARRTSGIVARDAAGRTRREDAGPGADRVVAIDDPVAGVRYILFPERAEGRKLNEPRERRPGPMGERWRGPRGAGGGPAVKTESLGTEVIAGVEAEGTRDTFTLPAGLHGHDSPVEVVSERWYSAELQAVVRHRHRDARGERTWTLTDITRGEPEASLFEVPAGFEIEEGHR